MLKKLTFLFVCSISVLSACAEQEPALELFLNSDITRNSNITLLVKNITTDKVIASYRPNVVVPPASTMKLLTTATALELYGGNYRFETYLESDGELKDGELKGNLYIRGTGDPTLGSQKVGNQMFLYKWAQQMVRLGIKKISGSVVADMSFFDGEATNPGWIWEDIGNYYAPGIFSIAYMDNTMNIQLRSAQIGSVAEVVKTIPDIPEVSFENHIRCTEIQYDGAYVHGMPYNNTRYLVGSVPSNRGIFGVKGDIPNPGLLLARHFTQALRQAGIEVTGDAGFIAEPQVNANGQTVERDVLYTHLSEPLREIVKETNMNSNNLYAEQLFRFLGSRQNTPATINNSVQVIQHFWKQRKVDISTCIIQDGCGLSPIDGMSAEIYVRLLTYMLRSANAEDFIASLPVAGESGTLTGFCLKTPLQHNLKAKSGTTSKVKSYAGYINAQNGDTWAFAIIINNPNGKVKQAQAEIQRFLNRLYKENL